MTESTVTTETTIHDPSLYRYIKSASGSDGFHSIGIREQEKFHEEGYLVIHNAFPHERIQDALNAINDLIDGSRPDFKGIQFEPNLADQAASLTGQTRHDAVRKLHDFIAYDQRFKALYEDLSLLKILEQLMGKPPELFQDMALLKPPLHGSEKPWHQDCAYFNLPLSTTVIGVWIALHEATPENGCMHIIPRSHREGPVVHFNRRDWQICDDQVRVDGDVWVPLEPGGCLLFHGLLHHGTPANRSPSRRHALQFHYKPSGTPSTSVEERLAVFGSEGKNVTC